MNDDKIYPSVTTWAGALIGGMGALSLTEWMAILGFTLALLGFCVNTWHRIASYRLQKRLAEAEIARLSKPD